MKNQIEEHYQNTTSYRKHTLDSERIFQQLVLLFIWQKL